MAAVLNALGQPVGRALPDWTARQRPARQVLQGVRCRLEPLDAHHATDLFASYVQASGPEDWTYLPFGPFESETQYQTYVETAACSEDSLHFAVIDEATTRAVGTLALMSIDPTNGVIEVGWVTFSPLLKRTTLSTEAHYVLMRYALEMLGYRRYEWRCDSLNAPSRKAAERMGFSLEGVFRNAGVYKGRNRDRAWFSITAEEWPAVRAGFERWLSPDNFDGQGVQRLRLTELRLLGEVCKASTVAHVAHADAVSTPDNAKRLRITPPMPKDQAA